MFARKAAALCCAAVLLLIPLTAVADGAYRMAGFDGDDSRHVWETNGFFTRMEARTGIGFTFDMYTDFEKWQQAKASMFATGELPDVLFKAELTTREQIAGLQSGQLIDLAPLLPDYAPNLWDLLVANPAWLEAITLPGGAIVALPTINELSTQNAMWINRQWLDTLHLAMPTTLDALAETLRAFKTGDPNRNGSADEIPLSFLGPWELKFLAHAVGLVANDYNVFMDGEGTVGFMPMGDTYLNFVQRLRDFYAEGLLDAEGFTNADALRVVTDEKAAACYGVFWGPNPMNLLPYATAAQYALLPPLVSNGVQMYRDLNGDLMRGTFALTSACEDPAALLAWVDTLYTPQGAVEAMAGAEGVDYWLAGDGTWTYAGDMQEKSSYILYDLSIYDTGNMPWLFPQDFYSHYQSEAMASVNAQLAALKPYLTEPFPPYTLTPEQEDEIAPLQKELGLYVDGSLARFVLGEWDIRSPEVRAEYARGLAQRGLEPFVAFWQSIALGRMR